jgi:2-polyprenyl-6-methoxyphenol hydroxylase-like FAD-dependent oxidoreductase
MGREKVDTGRRNTKTKRSNIHIARQSLRMELLNQLGDPEQVKWSHQLLDFKEDESKGVTKISSKWRTKTVNADLVVGADGIRSTVRRLIMVMSRALYGI